ncbi:Deoxyribose-phosphate aldolase [Candidatus Hydrogenisulfobacillus filiaventi]|uniref:Deoxyribose-phosphate aldolase n=1 Tax=Candidatus Hydrogenisulfobacillus filiaventi TaxID=2707344 RepID=A0A6F8ZK23_9FIRM|nr:Deoxyribose-phosphate aldolase [Candidatus Hydrogenisulfobacillus filiaventi]
MADTGLDLTALRERVREVLGPEAGERVPEGGVPVHPVTVASVGELAGLIDHTLLAPMATPADIRHLCEEARAWGCATVCVPGQAVPVARSCLGDSPVGVCAVAGFPLGNSASAVKAYEARKAVEDGAAEIDVVIALGWLKAGDWHGVWADLREVREAVPSGVVVKAILETAALSETEKAVAALLAVAAGADYVKTSTGFGAGGATVADVTWLRRVIGGAAGVKAAGGIRTWGQARALLAAGANRLGASRTGAILAGYRREEEAPRP